MPWWIIAYLGLFAASAVAGLWHDYLQHRPAWFLGVAALANATVGYLFVAFWHPVLRDPLGLLAPAAFLGALAWELFQAFRDVRSQGADPQLSKTDQRVVATFAGIAVFVLCVPAFLLAGIAAFRA